MKRSFPGASPYVQVSVDGRAGESASSRDFLAAGWVVTWALGLSSPPPPPPLPRVFKRKERRLVKSFVIFAVSLATGPVETHFASLLLGSWTRRGCENRRWKLAGWRGTTLGCDRRSVCGDRGLGCTRWALSPQLVAERQMRARCGSRYSGKSTCPHFRDR